MAKKKKEEIIEEPVETSIKEKSFFDKYNGIIFSSFITFVLCLGAFGCFYTFYLKELVVETTKLEDCCTFIFFLMLCLNVIN